MSNIEKFVGEHKARQIQDNEEVKFFCPWCPCQFCQLPDFEAHLNHFGWTEEKHRYEWLRKRKKEFESLEE